MGSVQETRFSYLWLLLVPLFKLSVRVQARSRRNRLVTGTVSTMTVIRLDTDFDLMLCPRHICHALRAGL